MVMMFMIFFLIIDPSNVGFFSSTFPMAAAVRSAFIWIHWKMQVLNMWWNRLISAKIYRTPCFFNCQTKRGFLRGCRRDPDAAFHQEKKRFVCGDALQFENIWNIVMITPGNHCCDCFDYWRYIKVTSRHQMNVSFCRSYLHRFLENLYPPLDLR